MPRIVRGVVLHVKGLDHWTLAHELADLVVDVNLSAQHVRLPVREESGVELLSGGGGVGSGQLIVDGRDEVKFC